MRKNKAMIFWFCLPAVLCLLLMFVYPVCRTVLMSFFRVESLTAGVGDWSFFGLGNYAKIFSSRSFTAMSNMVVIWLVGGLITLALALLMSVVLTSGIRGKKFFRAAIYMPNIISAVALATMWIQYIFQYDYGLLNTIVQLFGGDKVKWLGTDLKFWAMTASFIFGSVGYYMLIYISGIEGIPQDLYEAATLDGASKVQQFFRLTLPLLKGVIRRRSRRGADSDHHRGLCDYQPAVQKNRSGILREVDCHEKNQRLSPQDQLEEGGPAAARLSHRGALGGLYGSDALLDSGRQPLYLPGDLLRSCAPI